MNAQKPKLIVIAGPNGSGKTSVTRKILKHDWMDGCVYINPDDIARDKFGDWNSPDAVMQAARHATEIRHKCLNNKERTIPMKLDTSKIELENIIRSIIMRYLKK